MTRFQLLTFTGVVLLFVWLINGWIAAILLFITIIGFMIKDRRYWFPKRDKRE